MSDPTPETGYARGAGRSRLFYRWHPAAEPKGTLVITHGFGEHSGRYLHLLAWLNQHGWSALAYDYRGHGRADGRRAYVDRYDDYLDDLGVALDLARERSPGSPLFLIGHSQGGLITATYAARRRPDVLGMALSGPAMGLSLPVPGWKDALGRAMSRWWPSLTIPTGLDPGLVSRDPDVVAAYRGDPLVLTKATARWYVEFITAQAAILELAPSCTLPTLLMQGTDDGLVSVEASRRFFDRLGAADKTWQPYGGWYHEIFNEPDKEQVFDALGDWLSQHLPGD